MSTFITHTDYSYRIKPDIMSQITGDDDLSTSVILQNAEDAAVGAVKDALSREYDIDDIFSKTGTDRDPSVVRWVTTLVIYYLYERIPDRLVPERVVKNYDDTLNLLTMVAKGKHPLDLPHAANEEGEPQTRFRWGSAPRRTHDV